MTDSHPGPLGPGLGSVLGGRYRLEQCVGRGGMADVYRAEDELLHRTVAVKLFRLDAGVDSERLRIDAEMRTLAGLRHHGLVTLYDASADGDPSSGLAPYLVMEFIDGETLRHRIAAGPMPPTEVAALGAELASSLRYVHANGVVHRDVKPANILMDTHEDGSATRSAKLTDFGIARFADGARITEYGTTVGTANYLSPEQALGREVGPASDVYSLGLVLIECLTGAVVFPGSGVKAAMARLNRPPEVPTGFGPEWSELLTRMTDRDPDVRPDPDAIVAALQALVAQPEQATAVLPVIGTAAPMPTAATSVVGPDRPDRRHRPSKRVGYVMAAVAAAAVAAIVIGLVASSSDNGTGPTTAAVTYPPVTGQLGRQLHTLEATLAGTSPAITQLRLDVRNLAAAAAAKHFAAADAALNTLQLDLAAANAAGTIDDATFTRIRAAAAPLPADLTAAAAALVRSGSASSPSPAARSTTAQHTTKPAGPAKPSKAPKPGKGHGHGPGGGGGDD